MMALQEIQEEQLEGGSGGEGEGEGAGSRGGAHQGARGRLVHVHQGKGTRKK